MFKTNWKYGNHFLNTQKLNGLTIILNIKCKIVFIFKTNALKMLKNVIDVGLLRLRHENNNIVNKHLHIGRKKRYTQFLFTVIFLYAKWVFLSFLKLRGDVNLSFILSFFLPFMFCYFLPHKPTSDIYVERPRAEKILNTRDSNVLFYQYFLSSGFFSEYQHCT